MHMNMTGPQSMQAVIHTPPQIEQRVMQLYQLQQKQLMFQDKSKTNLPLLIRPT